MLDVISDVESAYKAELKRLENCPSVMGHDGKPVVMPVVAELVAAVKTHIAALERLGAPEGDFYLTGSD